MGILQTLFGGGTKSEDIKNMLANGAVVIDVRTPGEFSGGHVAGSKNIPLQSIQNRVEEIKKMRKPVVLCCASGGRSGQATNYLKSIGVECENGGGWMKVNSLI